MRCKETLQPFLALLPLVHGAFLDQNVLQPAAVDPVHPLITPAPASTNWRPTRTRQRRGLLDDVTSYGGQVLSKLGSAVPSYVASGVPNFFQDFPTGDKVQSSLGLDDDQVKALPTQVLNIPGYGNWTEQGWNLRFHGNVYKQPNISTDKLNDLANVFLVDTSVEELPPDQAAQARNLTSEIFVLQQSNQNVTFVIEPATVAGAGPGEQGGGGAVTPKGGNQTVKFPIPTTGEGDFDGFVQIDNNGLEAGNSTQDPQRLDVYAQGDINGNATAYLVPENGITVISDIDDILRITKIFQPKEGLLNSFARPFTQWEDMPNIYYNWSSSVPAIHFHYLTTTPEQITRNYMDFIYKVYPGGSFDTRPLNFSDVSATLSIRKFLLEKIFQTFPKRKFVLVADTSNPDVMKDYPQMAKEYPGAVACILQVSPQPLQLTAQLTASRSLRNTSNTDPSDLFPYDTSEFKGVDNKTYMFFNHADDLTNLNIAAGQCVNSTIPQAVTYSYQGVPSAGDIIKGKNAAPCSAASSTLAFAAALGTSLWIGLNML